MFLAYPIAVLKPSATITVKNSKLRLRYFCFVVVRRKTTCETVS